MLKYRNIEKNIPTMDVILLRQRLFNGQRMGRFLLTAFVIAWFGLLILLPLTGIVQQIVANGATEFVNALRTETTRHAFFLTIVVTVAAVVVNTVLGVVLALFFARSRFCGKTLLESLLDLPFAVSPVVAGFMFILLFGPRGWLGNWFAGMNIKIIYALPGMILVTLFVTLPFVVREILPILREFGIQQEEAAATLGANGRQTFFRVTLPTIKWGLAYGVTLTIARSIGEFGAVLVVSGGIINSTQTATLMIHEQFADLNYAGAFSASLLLAGMSFVILALIQILYKKKEEPSAPAGITDPEEFNKEISQ